jgi:hypothetical protein
MEVAVSLGVSILQEEAQNDDQRTDAGTHSYVCRTTGTLRSPRIGPKEFCMVEAYMDEIVPLA